MRVQPLSASQTMNYSGEAQLVSNLDRSAARKVSELSGARSSARPPLSPSAMMLAGVVSFLTFGGAIVATAAMVALQIR